MCACVVLCFVVVLSCLFCFGMRCLVYAVLLFVLFGVFSCCLCCCCVCGCLFEVWVALVCDCSCCLFVVYCLLFIVYCLVFIVYCLVITD